MPSIDLPRRYATSILVFVAGCGGGSSASYTSLPSAQMENVDDSTLASGDVFDVRVFGEPELSASYRVQGDGSIDFPLIGRTPVAGLEPGEIASRIAGALKEGRYLVDPQVSVFVKEYTSKQVSVLGAVARPGSFAIRPGMTVIEAISMAGGFTPLANRDETRITRREGEHIRRVRVEADRITSGRRSDIPVRAGDTIFVPERVF